jgi:sialic acid synthase
MTVPIVYQQPQIIAEIGCNHLGDFDIAVALVHAAHAAGATVAKFQKRHPKELLSPAQYAAPHPNPWHSYGATYGEHREKLELTLSQHAELQKICDKLGILYSASVWDLTSAKEIISLNPRLIKVPSACNTHLDLLRLLRDTYSGEVHVSLGMTTPEEAETMTQLFEETGAARDRLVLYSCTSGYPVSFSDVCLLEISRMYDVYANRVKAIGFSGHHLGIAVDIAAYALGAVWIERHFTKDRTWKGTDHAASLEPSGLSKLIRDLNAVHVAMRHKAMPILDIEKPQREKLKYIA